MKLDLAALMMVPCVAVAQDAETLKARIEAHYAAIHAGDGETVGSHHPREFTIFPMTGQSSWMVGLPRLRRTGTELSWPGPK